MLQVKYPAAKLNASKGRDGMKLECAAKAAGYLTLAAVAKRAYKHARLARCSRE